MDGALEPPASIFTVPLQRRKLSDRPVDQCATLKKPARTDASVVAGASAAAREGHFSQHSVKLPPQGQASGEIGPRALGNGGFPGFTNPTREGACVRAVAVEWGIGVLSTAGQQPPARLREVALASSALDNLDAHQIHHGAIDLILTSWL